MTTTRFSRHAEDFAVKNDMLAIHRKHLGFSGATAESSMRRRKAARSSRTEKMPVIPQAPSRGRAEKSWAVPLRWRPAASFISPNDVSVIPKQVRSPWAWNRCQTAVAWRRR
uniref:Uncharacterized protein n=1 Tax=Streptomyces auratus AGR0001 TaxID=1160718 RepID=J2K0U2_9ACTN